MADTVEMIRVAIIVVAGGLLVAAALVGLVRLSKGPTTLDRAVSTDLLLGIVIAALAIEAMVNRHTLSLPVMLVLALLSFAGPVAIARFIVDPTKDGKGTGPDPHSDDDDTDADSLAQNRAANADRAEVEEAESDEDAADAEESAPATDSERGDRG